MSQFLGSGAFPSVTTGQITIWDAENNPLYLPSIGYGYRDRGPQAVSFQWNTRQMWPWAGFLSGDPSVRLCPFGGDARDMDIFGPWSLGLGGTRRPLFLRGICKDSIGNILGGAIVQAFITATDIFVAEQATDDRGQFEIPCILPVAHYLVAYYPGSPDKSGASVNTLIPSL